MARAGRKGWGVDTIAKVCELLDEIKNNLLSYEKATQDMLTCDVDDVEHYITLRAGMANKMDALLAEIEDVCATEENANTIYQAALARLPFSEVPPELVPVFEFGQSNRSAVARIGQTEKQVMERLEGFRQEARDNLRQNQNMPKIRQYLGVLADKAEHESLTNGKA